MEFLKKFLEVVNFSKDHWLVILSCLILSGSVGGTFYIESKENEIKALESRLKGMESKIADLKDDINKYEEGKVTHLSIMKITIDEQDKTIKMLQARLITYDNHYGTLPKPNTVHQKTETALNSKAVPDPITN